ncbi:MAG TPA: hypothetical protein VFK38_04335 [Candidatus Limnocylindrales bacterium]|nr:hypothetical protein [Candidatus Limnocylindrales bacterium]
MVALLAALLAVGGLASQPMPVAAATAKVVIVVGPTGSQTAKYIDSARRLAAQARGYGAAVYEIYSPNATWSRVRSVAQGANLFIYLGHGNGWPSPYCCFQPYTKDGLGLNKVAGAGHSNVRYYGEYYLKNYIRLAPDSVVILNRLCYASGNSEWGTADPSLSTARKRVDNYGAGFLRTGARAVFAEAIASTSYVLYGLFRTSRSVSQIFWSAPNAKRTYASSFSSVRTPGKRALLDPTYRTKYWRSVIGDLGMTASTWR